MKKQESNLEYIAEQWFKLLTAHIADITIKKAKKAMKEKIINYN